MNNSIIEAVMQDAETYKQAIELLFDQDYLSSNGYDSSDDEEIKVAINLLSERVNKKTNRELNEVFHESKLNMSSFNSVHARCMLNIKRAEAALFDAGYIVYFDTSNCAWQLRQEIINRPKGDSLMFAGESYVEFIEYCLRLEAGIDCN